MAPNFRNIQTFDTFYFRRNEIRETSVLRKKKEVRKFRGYDYFSSYVLPLKYLNYLFVCLFIQ